MDLNTLMYFKEIAETGSLTRAAEHLHVSQPAMSAMLKKLEEELGVSLFDRSPNRIFLNKTGEIALIHVNTILRNVEQMKADLRSTAQQGLTLSAAFCDPGVRWFTVPRFSVAYPQVQVLDDLYEGTDGIRLLSEHVYDLVVTPYRLNDSRVRSMPFLSDQVHLSVPKGSSLLNRDTISLREIPAQPLLYPQVGGYFLTQMEEVISRERLPIRLIKNNFNVTQHLIRTTNFLATVSTLSMDLRNDGTHRALIPMSDPELNVLYYVSFLKSCRNKVRPFLEWAEQYRP